MYTSCVGAGITQRPVGREFRHGNKSIPSVFLYFCDIVMEEGRFLALFWHEIYDFPEINCRIKKTINLIPHRDNNHTNPN